MFLFKKIVAPFFFPLPLWALASLAGLYLLWFTRRQKAGKIIVSAGFFFLAITSSGFIFDFVLKDLEQRYPPLTDLSSVSELKWIVVLGGGHSSDPELPVNSQISAGSLMRLIEGIRIHNHLPGSKLILSGGGGFDPVPNAKIMSDVAAVLDVKENDIVLEPNSRDTKDEARLIGKIVKNDKFILVTTASHMPRAMKLFGKLNMHPVAAPVDFRIKANRMNSPRDFFPGSTEIRNAELVFHEYLGTVWGTLRGQI
jgi:uncharacterized SAM-binding protein YcdF (DUF218 family)